MSELNIFGPNNHSKYEIGWKNIPADLELNLKQLIKAQYGFEVVGAIQEVDDWERMSNNLKVKVSRQNTAVDVLFRKHIQLKDEVSVVLLDKVLDFLHGGGLVAPRVILTSDKKKFFKHNESFYQLYEFIPGNHYRGEESELRDFARGLASLHLAFQEINFKDEIAKKPNVLPPWNLAGWQNIFALAHLQNSRFDNLVRENKDLILESADSVEKNLKGVFSTTQVVRGDLHPHDTIYENGKLKALIDFEGVRVSELLREVGNACHRFVRQFVVYQKKDWQETLPQGIRIFLGEYGAVNPLDEKEIKLIPAYIRDELLKKLFKDLNLYYLNNYDKNIEGGELEKKLTLLKEASIINQYI